MTRLPDLEFFQFVEDNDWTVVEVRRHATGGAREYFIVNSVAELAALMAKLPPRACVSLAAVHKLSWEDSVTTPDADGNCRPGAY